jgi:hypothetical protein
VDKHIATNKQTHCSKTVPKILLYFSLHFSLFLGFYLQPITHVFLSLCYTFRVQRQFPAFWLSHKAVRLQETNFCTTTDLEVSGSFIFWWMWVCVCDISHYENDLNTKLQSQQKFISDMIGAVRAFEMKLKLFQKQLEILTCVIFLLWFASWGWISKGYLSKCLCCRNDWFLGWEF